MELDLVCAVNFELKWGSLDVERCFGGERKWKVLRDYVGNAPMWGRRGRELSSGGMTSLLKPDRADWTASSQSETTPPRERINNPWCRLGNTSFPVSCDLMKFFHKFFLFLLRIPIFRRSQSSDFLERGVDTHL
jgi:hypothetical protein